MQETHIALGSNQDSSLASTQIDSTHTGSETTISIKKRYWSIRLLIIVGLWLALDITIGKSGLSEPFQDYILTITFILYLGLLYWWNDQ